MANQYTKKTKKFSELRKKISPARRAKTKAKVDKTLEQLEVPVNAENGEQELKVPVFKSPDVLQSEPVRPESLRERINMEVSGAIGYLAYAKREMKRAEDTLAEAERRLFDARGKQTAVYELETDF